MDGDEEKGEEEGEGEGEEEVKEDEEEENDKGKKREGKVCECVEMAEDPSLSLLHKKKNTKKKIVREQRIHTSFAILLSCHPLLLYSDYHRHHHHHHHHQYYLHLRMRKVVLSNLSPFYRKW